MRPNSRKRCVYQVVELDGVRYAIVRESVLRAVCRQAGVQAQPQVAQSSDPEASATELDDERLARRLVQRRKRTGLTQAALARRAGIRVETLNRVERGKTTPDFSTVRKLVNAMNEAESELATDSLVSAARGKE